MKRYFTILCLWFLGTLIALAQQFPIGGYGIYKPVFGGLPVTDTIPPGIWHLVRDAGFTHVHFFVPDTTPQFNMEVIQRAREHGMHSVPTYTWPGNRGYDSVTTGRRWRHQPEYSVHFPSFQGRVGEAYADNFGADSLERAVKDADAFDSTFNSWRAVTGTHSAGHIGITGTVGGQVTNNPLHVRVRLRLPDYQNVTHGDSVLRMRVTTGGTELMNTGFTTEVLKRTPWTDGIGDTLRSNDQYGEVHVGQFTKQQANGTYQIEVYWHGLVSVNVDYIAVDDDSADVLFRGDYDDVLDLWQQQYGNGSGPALFMNREEPLTTHLTLIGYIEERIQKFNYPSGQQRIRTISFNWEGQRDEPLRFMLETRQAQYSTDIYPIRALPEHTRANLENENNMADFQGYIDQEISENLKLASTDINRYNPFHSLWYCTQLHSWSAFNESTQSMEPWNREPANDEIRMLVNIAMCYGAKGIWYFQVKAADNCGLPSEGQTYLEIVNGDTLWFPFVGLIDPCNVPRTNNSYGENKYAGVTAINKKLAVLGPHLVNLRWQDAFSRHNEDEDFPNNPPVFGNFVPKFALLDSLKITRLRTYDQQGRMDIFTDRYVEVGWLRNPTDTTEFIYVTNRRVLDNGGRMIVIGFNGTENLAYKDMYSRNIDVISVNADSLQVTLDPGDGTLLRIDSARWRRNEIVEETLTIHPKATLRIAPGYTLTVSDTGTVLIKDSATLVLEKGSNLAVNRGGRFLFEGPNSKLILAGDDTISGGGSIVNANIILRGDIRFHIPEGDTLKFQGGGKLECDEYYDPDSSRLVILGHVRFEDAGDEYQFGWCIDSIHVDDGTQQIVSIFETAPGVTLSFLPNLVSWQQGRMYGRGNTSDSSRWQFRNEANCDVYGHLIASHTIFEASPLDSIPSWDGILVAYENSLIQLDSCYLHQIRVHPSSGGSAIHFYQSLSFDNRINNCIIRRIAGQGTGKLGDAIFLQPGGTASYVKITCCLIDQDWYTGVGAIGSWFDLINSTVTDNNIGVGMNIDSHALLYSTAISGHALTGVYTRLSELRLGILSGPGNNIITENDTTQISIDTASTVTGGMIGNPGNNEISHSSPSNRRVWVAPSAVVGLRKNWWGVADSSGFSPDSCLLKKSTEDAFFSYSSAQSFQYTYVLCEQPMIFIDCDNVYNNSILFLKQSNLPPYASSLQDLVRYAHEGNFSEVYRFVGNVIAQSSDPTRIITAANVALHLEVGHARRFPDSTLTSRTRLTGFLQGRFNASSNALVKSGLLFLWSRALFALGAVSQSETKVTQLRSQFSSSPYAREALPLMQLIAMAKRDTLGMENVVSEMAQAGFTETQMQQAYNMRRGYYRVLPRSFFQKASDEAERMVPVLESNGQLVARAYPNPFNPSTTIEYAIPETMPVKLRVFDLLGREIERLVDGWQQEGTYAEVFDASHLPSGVYVYVLSTPYSHVSGRLLLIK